MAGDHKCPVCGSTFTRSQHVARHMRSHTGDRPYKCVHCGDQFARSDLLSRHVNKCHINDKKAGGAGGRVRKPRQTSTSVPAPQAQNTPLTNLPQPLVQHQRQPQFTHSTTSDPFHPGPQLYTTHEAYPPRSFHSGSHPSSASVSLDNLSAGLSYALPATAPNYTARAQNAYLPGYRQTAAAPTHFEHSVAKHDDSGVFANPPAQNGFTDPSTSLAYPYKHRAGSNGSSDGHSNTSSNAAYGSYGQVHGYGSEGHASGLGASNAMSYIPQPNPEAPNAPDGGFSSSFGLMSLEDPAVLAGVSSGVPFFDTNSGSQHHLDLHGLLPPLPIQMFDSMTWNASGLGGGPNNSNVTPGTREREANQLRELWSAFLRDPTARLNPDGTEVQRPDFPAPSLHRRSSSYSGPGKPGNNSNNGNNGYQQQPASSTKTPHMPGPQQPLAGGANVVAQLEAQAARDQQQRVQQQPKAAQLVAHVASHASPEALKNYEEAILARKAPILKFPPKLKLRDSANTASGSSVLPSISQTNRSIPGNSGGVASLASGSQLLTIAAASSVPPGSTPNQGLAALQQHGQPRLVLPLPKPRSRPGTSTGHYSSDQSPTSVSHSAPPTPIHVHHAPSSRPTSAGQHSQVDPRTGTSTSGGLNSGVSNESRPSTGGSTTSNSTWQPGYAAHPGPGQMLPPPHIPNAEKQLAEYNAAMCAALNMSSNSGASPASSGRPSYKRLASQILESAAIKRARDDLNNTSAIEDDDEDEEHHPQRQREGSTESNEPGSSAAVSSMGSHSGHSSSFGQDRASFAEYRRMSEPSSGARAYPRSGNLTVAHSNVGPGVNEVAQVSPPGSVAAHGVREIPNGASLNRPMV